jgi:hypothetical protein
LIAEITRRVVGEYGIDQARIYVAGLSAGGAARGLSRSLCCRWCACLACGSAHDVRFQRDARIGKQREQPRPTVVKPTIVFHGDMDETVHPCNGAKVIARVSRRPICGPRPKGRSRPKGKASPILCIATRPGSAYLNYGNPPARATLGPAAVWQDHSPAKMVRTRHARCRASSFNIDFQNREH